MSQEEILPVVIKEESIEEIPERKNLPHQEAIEFVEKNRDLFEHYARGRVKFAPAPAGLNTFAFDLKTNTIYINSKFYEELGFSEEKTAFATLHEIEHFLEKVQLLAESDGEEQFVKYLKRLQESKAFSLMDNCLADIRENRTVVEKTHQGFSEIEKKCYREDLFQETDFTAEPKHIQFVYALLREARVLGEECLVAPAVRQEINKLRAITGNDGSNLFEVLTDPETSMSARLKLQDKFVWPIVKKLLAEDLQDEEKKKEDEKKSEEDSDEGGDGEKSDESDGSEKTEEGKEQKSESKKSTEDKSKIQNSSKDKKGQGEGGKEVKLDPNEVFQDAYDRAMKKVPNAVPAEETKKALEDWQAEQKENPLDKADKEYADKLGVKKEDLQKYRQTVEALNEIVNPETNENVIEELRALIMRIIAKHLKPQLSPQYPVAEGEDLVDPAQLIADVKAGNLEPKVWETHEIKEKKGKKFGEVEITLVCDRSGSMDENGGDKRREQQKATVLMLEVLKDFADICDSERVNLDSPLEVRSEVYSFQSDSNDAKPLKPMSKDLGEKERVDIFGALATTSGSTTDFVPLETINRNLTDELKKKILDGEVKKIVIVFTDGGSDDASRVKMALEKLRQDGIIVIGVGITESGRPAITTYAPEAKLVETAEKLPLVLGDLLKEHLNDL